MLYFVHATTPWEKASLLLYLGLSPDDSHYIPPSSSDHIQVFPLSSILVCDTIRVHKSTTWRHIILSYISYISIMFLL